QQPLTVTRGDRLIVRTPSPSQTIGGGVVVNPTPERRWKRHDPAVIALLVTQMQGTPAERIAHAAVSMEPLKRAALAKATGYTDAEFSAALESALADGLLIALGDGFYQSSQVYYALINRMTETLSDFHMAYPLRIGMPREALRSRIAVKNATLTLLLASQTDIVAHEALLRLHRHVITFSEADQAWIAQFAAALDAAPYTPPSVTEAAALLGEEVLHALIDLGDLIQIAPDVLLAHPVYDEMVAGTLALIDQEGSVSAKALRDRFNTSRKYAIALLEHLDRIGITRRQGDDRVRA
ncbi:MAG: SelB C-terminal domain-containing protein, partial [Armatimonadetes bacterium]|nr:SelB C-terminal domain-containing protein [Anaerolineae bacterium]